MTPPRHGDWINTFTGRKFWPMDPAPDEVCIEDIAHALSMQCRYTGHVKRFYSVAQHSVLVSNHVPDCWKLWGLMHDAAEAYLVDLARPIKRLPDLEAYRVAENRIMGAICVRFGLTPIEPVSVKEADNRMLITEARQLMNMHDDWLRDWPGEPYTEDPLIFSWEPSMAEAIFLQQFHLFTEGTYA